MIWLVLLCFKFLTWKTARYQKNWEIWYQESGRQHPEIDKFQIQYIPSLYYANAH